MPHAIQALLFDLDDTLNDRPQSWLKFVERLVLSGQLTPCIAAHVHQAILTADHGGYRPRHEFIADLREKLPWRTRPSPTALETYWRTEFPACTVARPTATDLLKSLRARGYKLGIVTNGRTETQQAKIEFLELHHLVDAIIISESIGIKKPHPPIFHAALAALDTRPQQSIFIGDNPERDIAGPAQVGMKTVWLQLGRPWPSHLKPPDHAIPGLEHFENSVMAAYELPSKS